MDWSICARAALAERRSYLGVIRRCWEGWFPVCFSAMKRCIYLMLMALGLIAGGCQATGSVEGGQDTVASRITPFLMFQDGRAEQAMNDYIAIFGEAGGGRIVSLERFGENAVGAPAESVQYAVFEIYGQRIAVSESPIKHPFDFTPAVSLFVDFESADEQQRVFEALSDGGLVMMPLDNYGFSERFAFIQDRYGVSWQLNLPSQ